MIGTKAFLILAIRTLYADRRFPYYPNIDIEPTTSVYETPTGSSVYTITVSSDYPASFYGTTTTSAAYTTDSPVYSYTSATTEYSTYTTNESYKASSGYPIDSSTTSSSAYPTDSATTTADNSSSYPTSTSTSCAGSNYNQVNITSPNTITAGNDFSITWTAPQPDPSKNHTEVHVELWALNGGPVGSPLLVYKSDRLFDVTSYTYSFPTSYVNATTKGGPVPWQLYVGVYSTYFSSNITDLESWNLPYYGFQKVTFQ
jgi:hypothetical protein